MMIRKTSLMLTLFALTAVPGFLGLANAEEPTQQKLGLLEGIIPQVATGGGSFFMDFQFVNGSSSASTVTLTFYDSDGALMAISYVQDGIESTASTLVEVVAPGGIEFARTVLDTPNAQIGFATVSSSPFRTVAVQTTFNQVVPDRPLFQAFIPEDTSSKGIFFLPSVNTGGQTSNLAVGSRYTQNVTYIGRNRNGVELCSAGRPFLEGEHHAFTIPTLLPCMAGVDGIVEVVGSTDEGLYGVGITAQDDGAFVTQPAVAKPVTIIL